MSTRPSPLHDRLDRCRETLDVVRGMRDPRVRRALLPSGVRGLLLRRGKQGTPTPMPAAHAAHFDWTYPSDFPEMASLYAMLANRGVLHTPRYRVDQPLDGGTRLLSEEASFITGAVMSVNGGQYIANG